MAIGPAKETDDEKSLLRYPPQGPMSSFEGFTAGDAFESKIVR